MQTFGDRLRDARTQLNLTQDELAELMQVTKSAVSGWENNREAPSFDKLGRLRQHLDASLDYLICGLDGSAWQQGRSVGEAPPPAWGNKRVPHDRHETVLVRRFRALPEKKKRALLALIASGPA